MACEIVYGKVGDVEFSEIKVGRFFVHEELLYVKAVNLGDDNAICIGSGCRGTFFEDDKVIPVDVRITVLPYGTLKKSEWKTVGVDRDVNFWQLKGGEYFLCRGSVYRKLHCDYSTEATPCGNVFSNAMCIETGELVLFDRGEEVSKTEVRVQYRNDQ